MLSGSTVGKDVANYCDPYSDLFDIPKFWTQITCPKMGLTGRRWTLKFCDKLKMEQNGK